MYTRTEGTNTFVAKSNDIYLGHILLLGDNALQGTLFKCQLDIANSPLLHLGLRLDCPRPHVRNKKHVWIVNQTRVNLGLFLVHVQTHAGDFAGIQGLDKRVLVHDCPAGRVYNNNTGLHEGELVGGDGMPSVRLRPFVSAPKRPKRQIKRRGGSSQTSLLMGKTHVQRKIEAQDVALGQEPLKGDVLCAVFQLGRQPGAVVVPNRHAEGARLGGHVPPDAAHAQDAEDFALRVVAEPGERRAAPVAGAEGRHADGEVAQRADEQPDCDVGGGVVDGRGCVGHADRVGCACLDVDLVVAGALVRALGGAL